MIITSGNLQGLFTGFKTIFNKGFSEADAQYLKIAMQAPSNTSKEIYTWLGQFPKMREWIGSRVIKNLKVHDYTIKNRKFENTIAVPADDISDDQYGVFTPMFEEMGRDSRQHPDELVFTLLASGFASKCYDGQYFFDADHPVIDENQETQTVSNIQDGANPAWFLLDTSRPVKPIVWQEREPYKFQALDKDGDENVFMDDEYIYGVRARANAGFGLWQLAHASKADLTSANYEAVRSAMMGQLGENGRKLNVKPTTLVVGPELEGKARRLLKATINGGETNEWADSAELIVSPHI